MSKKTTENTVKENDFTVDSVGRVVIVDNKELLEVVSGGREVGKERVVETKSDLFDPLFGEMSEMLENNNCGCTGGTGTEGW